MQTFQQYFYENKTILSHIMESRSGKWDIFIKFASSFEVLSFSIRFFAKFGRHFVSYLFGKPLAYRKRAAGIGHFTVVCLVTWPLSGSEAGGDLVLIQTLLLFTCKSCCSHAN